MDINQLKYPVGPYNPNKNPEKDLLESWINTIENFPSEVKSLTENLSVEELNWRYRPEGWTIKQVVHHCSDSHINSIVRFKLALTEESPTILPYYEDRWAELPDSLNDDISMSLQLLDALHTKWVLLLRSLNEEQLEREFVHPEHGRRFSLAETIGMYAWHCDHHLGHIKNALGSQGKH